MGDRRPVCSIIMCVAILVALGQSGAAWAQPGAAGPDQWSPGSVALKLLQAFASLAIVIALILLSYYALRRFSWPASSGPVEGPMHVIQALTVEPGRRLYLVKVGSKAYLLAWSAEAATFVAEVDPADIAASQAEAPVGDAHDA
ncbi:MAG TPA: hypothetical protein DGT21_15555 [Armatimonadetes bacterium]|nr:hypothetical protein [Armatimonadota bacterium]